MRGYRTVFLGVLICSTLGSAFSIAQTENAVQTETEPAPGHYSQAELDQLVAPIALYPDALLSQVLIASTYPLEVVKAQRWLQQNPGLSGNALDSALANEPWDASVKGIAAFPSVVAMMNDNLDWMQELGNAFLAQEVDVMDTVQRLRQKAQSAGTLSSDDRQQVTTQDGDIDIEPTNPDVIYVSVYDPTIAYGPWWWPDYPPLIWVPPPIYGPVGYVITGFGFGIGIPIGHAHFHDAHPDSGWHHIVIPPPHTAGSIPSGKPSVWQHNPGHRIGVPYPTESVRARYIPANPGAVIQRHEYRGFQGGAVQPSALSPLAPAPRASVQDESRRGHASLSARPFAVPRPIGQPSAPPVRGGQMPAQGGRHR
ncbi:MAG: DUF3300 domain-containing protein [Thiobacillaceae bacterium]